MALRRAYPWNRRLKRIAERPFCQLRRGYRAASGGSSRDLPHLWNADKPMFRTAKRPRCIVPASGCYQRIARLFRQRARWRHERCRQGPRMNREPHNLCADLGKLFLYLGVAAGMTGSRESSLTAASRRARGGRAGQPGDRLALAASGIQTQVRKRYRCNALTLQAFTGNLRWGPPALAGGGKRGRRSPIKSQRRCLAGLPRPPTPDSSATACCHFV
jgi:hypothetical protein